MNKTWEVNFDGLVGPTHNYSGLSYGNVASFNNVNTLSNPRGAALQGLEKMKFLSDLGVPQAVMPPPIRPNIELLKSLGFNGSIAAILSKAKIECPQLLSACYSAASMWTANAATISPSSDTKDKKVHITPANLISKFHRAIENPYTMNLLKIIFQNENYFKVHPPLPYGDAFADEGSANHNRFCTTYDAPGIELFVWGKMGFNQQYNTARKYPARQSFESSSAIARLHQLHPNKVLFVQQNPEAIDAGVFHNDVISVGNQNVFFFHENAFLETTFVIDKLNKIVNDFIPIKVTNKELFLEQAVSSYIFNSQLITLPSGEMCFIAPSECKNLKDTKNIFDKIIQDPKNPIKRVEYLNLHQSMKNGGGPACLRMRVVLNENEFKAIHQGVIFTDDLYQKIKQWILKNYREQLSPSDFEDPDLYNETTNAAIELNEILNFPSSNGLI